MQERYTLAIKRDPKTKKFCCPEPNCQQTFSRKYCMNRHYKIHESIDSYSCHKCEIRFSRKDNLSAHMRFHTDEKRFTCNVSNCDKAYKARKYLQKHYQRTHPDISIKTNPYLNKDIINPYLDIQNAAMEINKKAVHSKYPATTDQDVKNKKNKTDFNTHSNILTSQLTINSQNVLLDSFTNAPQTENWQDNLDTGQAMIDSSACVVPELKVSHNNLNIDDLMDDLSFPFPVNLQSLENYSSTFILPEVLQDNLGMDESKNLSILSPNADSLSLEKNSSTLSKTNCLNNFSATLEAEAKDKVNKAQLKRKNFEIDDETSEDLPFKNKKPQQPRAGIARKYLKINRTGNLPFQKSNKPKEQKIYENKIDLVQLKNFLLKSNDGKEISHSIAIINQNITVNLEYVSTKGIPKKEEAITFVIAGRGLQAFVPKPTSDSRVVLVMPKKQYKKIKSDIPRELDVLVIRKLESKSHGIVKDAGLPTPRRLATLLFVSNNRYNHCIMMDDNIKTIAFQHTNDSTQDHWKILYAQLLQKISECKSVCISLPTQFYKNKKHKETELGSKIFMFNMSAINNEIQTDQMFLLFPPSQCSDWWAEDYFMQLMLFEIFKTKGLKGYQIVPENEFCLIRSMQNRNACAKAGVGNKAKKWLHYKELLILIKLKKDEITLIERVCKHLSRIVKTNIKSQENAEERKGHADLIEKHAIANGLDKTSISLVYHEPEFAELLQAELFLKFKENIKSFINLFKSILTEHQIQALIKLSQYNEPTGLFTHATGTGKTFLSIAVCHCMHAIGMNKPIIIVTPTLDLVEQFYDDFITMINAFKKIRDNNPKTTCNVKAIDKAHVIKISSKQEHVHADLIDHASIVDKNLVFIICQKSFFEILDLDVSLDPSMILLDESHTLNEQQLTAINTFSRDSMILAFSATPKQELNHYPIIHTYTRREGVRDNHLAPIILNKFEEKFSVKEVYKKNCSEKKSIKNKFVNKNLSALLDNLSHFLTTHLHPSGLVLSQLKGAIYLPKGDKEFKNNIREKILPKLKEAKISYYFIHSEEKDYQTQLQQFLHHKGPAVAFTVDMLKIGYSDNNLDWIIIAQSGKNKDIVEQQFGRVMRTRKQAEKIGYVITFADVNIDNLNFDRSCSDTSAFLLASESFLEQNKRNLSISTLAKASSCVPDQFQRIGFFENTSTNNDPTFSFDPTVKELYNKIHTFDTLKRTSPQEKKNSCLELNEKLELLSEMDKQDFGKDRLLLQYLELRKKLKELSVPQLALSSSPKVTNPWSEYTSDQKIEHYSLVLKSKIKDVENRLKKFGVSNEELYCHGASLISTTYPYGTHRFNFISSNEPKPAYNQNNQDPEKILHRTKSSPSISEEEQTFASQNHPINLKFSFSNS